MQKLSIIVISLLLFSCKDNKNKPLNNEQVIFDRIAFVFNLKQDVDKKVWKTFNDKIYDLPLIYYTDSSSYVANPTEKFLNTFKSTLVFENNQINIYKTAQRIDNISFHMATGLTMGDPTNEYNYQSPFMNCSGFEETSKTIPDVLSTEEWITMIMHEYFHGFQYKHQAYLDFYEKNIVQVQPDSLKSIYKNQDWFKTSIDKENDYLLQAIEEKDELKRMILINNFFGLRNERRKESLQKLQFNIENYEKCAETMEGTARYVEYNLYNIFSTMPTVNILKADSSYKSFSKFKDFNLENEKWLYLTEKTTYYYAIGFNMARLLDKLAIDYKSTLFKQGGLSLEDILKAEYGGQFTQNIKLDSNHPQHP